MSNQSNKDCIFCKIISKEIPAKIIDENEHVLVIEDLHPKAPVHYLILPKKHIVNVKELQDSDRNYVAQMLLMARDLSKKLSGDGSFRLIMNNGRQAGQSVFHMHCHFLSGKKMTDF
ncbi:histidine triad nucleotide-binding protein [Candidatus Dependentiae bacterium]